MTNLPPDAELEAELQEVYMQATHWLQDISFLETETQFFKTMIDRYEPVAGAASRKQEFYDKVRSQCDRLEKLKAKIPEFLTFVKPFLGDLKQPMHLDFLNRYNALQKALSAQFEALRLTKSELFRYTESITGTKKAL